MKICIAISTYVSDKASDDRIKIIKECLDSFINVNAKVVIVNDASTNKLHNELLETYKDKFHIINRTYNGGIAKCKNTAIKYFEENEYDICFLIDDDMKVVSPDFVKQYVDAIENTGIEHLCYQVPGDHKNTKNIEKNDFNVIQSDHTNGCMLVLTKNIVKNIGYFKVLPHKYGHEHSNYTLRCIIHGFAPGFIDVVDSNNFIQLIGQSVEIHSGTRIHGAEFDENEHAAFENLQNEKYIECNE
ncbi:MAG: glycosyltransferase [Candidatus Pacearchaeota archaeon]|jgi:hypothetical protein|nr:glycosyltransferase [Clostridia bacterium]